MDLSMQGKCRDYAVSLHGPTNAAAGLISYVIDFLGFSGAAGEI
jgi:hypothetical protein